MKRRRMDKLDLFFTVCMVISIFILFLMMFFSSITNENFIQNLCEYDSEEEMYNECISKKYFFDSESGIRTECLEYIDYYKLECVK